ncbi:hypothetical protein LJC63_09100 [Ruminococcaceae bacterium OttesenSCG-928-L11]|nr:hypothetical protein [Ruminococcaceae bacterium OttesenSCG-928-L11]
MSKKGKKSDPEQNLQYKTETQLKEEALERLRKQKLLEAQRKPKSTREKKAENFWYHYRGATFGVILGLILVVMFVKDIFFKTDPDLSIVMVTTQYISAEYLEELTQKFENCATDVNGDGKVVVSIDHIPYTPIRLSEEDVSAAGGEDEAMIEAMQDTQTDYTYTMKLMTILGAGTDPIYVLDEANFDYLHSMGADSEDPYEMFLRLDESMPSQNGYGLSLADTTLGVGEVNPYFDSLNIYIRDMHITKKNADYIRACQEYVESLVK